MADECRTYDIDGEPVTVRSAQPLTGKDLRYLAEVTAAARKHFADNPLPVVVRVRSRLYDGVLRKQVWCSEHGWFGPPFLVTHRADAADVARLHKELRHEG